MAMPEKSHEIINKFYDYANTRNKKLIEGYTLGEIKQARNFYNRDNLKIIDLAPIMDDVIKELEYICDCKKREREKWIDRLIGFVFGIITALVSAYFIKLFDLR